MNYQKSVCLIKCFPRRQKWKGSHLYKYFGHSTNVATYCMTAAIYNLYRVLYANFDSVW